MAVLIHLDESADPDQLPRRSMLSTAFGNQSRAMWTRTKTWAVSSCTGGLFDLLSAAQLWPARRGAPVLVRQEALNQRVHAVSSQPPLMALPVRTKADDGSQPFSNFHLMCDFFLFFFILFFLFLCRVSRESLTFFTILYSPSSGCPLLIFPLSGPSQVGMMYDWCCQLLSHVQKSW